MKIDVNDNNYIIYLNKQSIKLLNFDNKEKLEDEFKKLFRLLKKYYNIEINGYYNIKIYNDKYYGGILEVNKENIDYYDYFDSYDTIAMCIKKYDVDFLYKVDDYFFASKFLNKLMILTNNDNIYIKIKQPLSKKEFFLLLEMSKIIYNYSMNLKPIKI